ncbi:MAG: CoA pyrophosphatase [Gammaproteobacteria bacterium]|nr:CoA pyrophosphatase [Gammaproteobacteria bacterium]MYK69860.1 CoA pyrophosphatase [Gammaproteobacteria bacterium]
MLAGDDPARQAAVALVVRRDPEPTFLLVRRAHSPRDPWSGQMALPGGRRDPEDIDLRETAVRETREEVGIDLDRSGTLLGRLPDLKPTSRAIPRLVIAPFVFRLSRDADARVASAEIAAVYWVPVADLSVPGARSAVAVETPAGKREFPCYRVEGHPVWGLTYRILQRFLRSRLAELPPVAGDNDQGVVE